MVPPNLNHYDYAMTMEFGTMVPEKTILVRTSFHMELGAMRPNDDWWGGHSRFYGVSIPLMILVGWTSIDFIGLNSTLKLTVRV